MTKEAKDLDRLEADYRAAVAKIRQEPGLSWEKQERTIRELGLEYDRKRRQLEEDAA